MRKDKSKHNEPKLAIRRHMFAKFDIGPRRVLDCFQGDPSIWETLKREYQIESYWGISKKQRSGRLKIDPLDLLSETRRENVIDIDTVGSPWRHWQVLLPNIRKPTIVFLTYGRMNKTPIDNVALQRVGLDKLQVPNGILTVMTKFAIDWLLSIAELFCKRAEFFEHQNPSEESTRFFGVYLEPILGESN